MGQLSSDALGSHSNMGSRALFVFAVQLLLERGWSIHFRVVAHSTLVLPCLPRETGIDHLPITWTHNGQAINPSKKIYFTKKGMYLSISNITPESEGNYTCGAREEDMEWRNTHTITVEKVMGYTMKIHEGSDINLNCMRRPGPQQLAYALWYKVDADGNRTALMPLDGQEELNGSRVEWLFANPRALDQTITIRKPVVRDSGAYHCASADGELLTSIQLIVEVVPPPPPHTCGSFASAWEPCVDNSSRSWGPILTESLSEFSTRFYHHVRQLLPTENLLFSPVSIAGLLSHLLLGARGATRRRLEEALSLPSEFSCLHLQMSRMRHTFNGSLYMASQIYHHPDLTITETFLSQSLEFYSSRPVPLHEDGEINALMINNWVSNQTRNLITHLLDYLEPQTQLLLLNAVAFNGQWKTKFETGELMANFTKLDGEQVEVPVLYSSKLQASNKYLPELSAQVMLFPLTGESSLYILLPRSHTLADLKQLEEGLTSDSMARIREELESSMPEVIEVYLPKIQLEAQTDMDILLRRLGLAELFEAPNLCGLHTEAPLRLDGALHRASLALTEEGVVAGAATATIYSRSFPTFAATRPFVLLLWSDAAGAPLFMGRVTEP